MSHVPCGLDADRALVRLRSTMRTVPPAVELGSDLFATTRLQLLHAIGRPCLTLAAYVVAARAGWWLVAVPLVSMVFLANVSVVHDLMHRSLGLRSTTNSALLGLLALLMLDCGHVLQVTHAEHHRRFPSAEDPEAYLAGWPWWRVLLEGPRYRYRLWRWAWRHHPERRGVVLLEAAAHLALVTGAAVAALLGVAAMFTVYVGVAVVGGWLFPIISVYAVHDVHGATQFQRSRTVRGRVVPKVLLGMGYHLEHHLWPTIPAHHLDEAAARATTILERERSSIVRVP